MYILGLWDGHDSGAALIKNNKVIYAANEERFTKRKLEIKFPYNSIKAALEFEKITPSDVKTIAFPTLELTKTVSRIFPSQKEYYYKFRRRKIEKPIFENLMHYQKYAMTSIGVLPLCNSISKYEVSKKLRSMGFKNFRLYGVDHHKAHAATAAFTSGFKKQLVVTMDGVGDGLCSSISTFENNTLERKKTIGARNSIGIFYEQITNILGMRELEDEGKIMAMADYSYPFSFKENKLKGLFEVNKTDIKSRFGPISQYRILSKIAWNTPREQLAYMAQQLLEEVLIKYFSNLKKEFGYDFIATSGGTMSNVKANMLIREKTGIKDMYIFPHMGDGGIALGAAMQVNYELNQISEYSLDNIYLGNEYGDEYIKNELKKYKQFDFELDKNKSKHAAELIHNDNYLFWFQGRMEYGPRALGNRSIIAKPSSDSVKDKLNLFVKKREWFQPFAPSILEEEKERILENAKGKYNKFMTTAYKVKKDFENKMKSVVHIDMTARPQMVGLENKNYMELLKHIKKLDGLGVILNTSLNIHGMPIAMEPVDAIKAAIDTKTRYLFIGNYFVENKNYI
ncbi:MAG: carbamoyltransferase C-terminal domain-containing protein [Candidatus Micrarchaeaceae archaeon]